MPRRIAPGHRHTLWLTESGEVTQVAVACLDSFSDPTCEVTEEVGPFETPQEALARAEAVAHRLGGWRAHQQALSI